MRASNTNGSNTVPSAVAATGVVGTLIAVMLTLMFVFLTVRGNAEYNTEVLITTLAMMVFASAMNSYTVYSRTRTDGLTRAAMRNPASFLRFVTGATSAAGIAVGIVFGEAVLLGFVVLALGAMTVSFLTEIAQRLT